MQTIDLHTLASAEASVGDLAGVARLAEKNLGCLEDRLLTLRLSFGKLRAAIEAAFAPVTAALTPVLNAAMASLTAFFDDVGTVLSALLGTVYKKTVTTTRAVGGAVRRTLAHFDQINRLNGGSGSGGSQKTVTLEPINDKLTPRLREVVERIRGFIQMVKDIVQQIRALIAPLLAIDLTPALQALSRLGQAISQLGALIGQNLQWAWFHVLVPLAQWTIEAAVPASVDLLTAALTALTTILEPVLAGIRQLLPALTPVADFLGSTLIALLQSAARQFEKLAQSVSASTGTIEHIFTQLGQCVTTAWASVKPALETIRDFWLQVFDAVGNGTANWVAYMLQALSSLTDFIGHALAGSWSAAFDSLKGVLRGACNGIISIVNTMLSCLASAVNGLAQILNKWSVSFPDWLPGVGGKSFGFRLPTVSAPQIPFLAQGAVLPANRPFLAVVGDQRHGTNVEAPLKTIQEAVSLAMADMAAADQAGHEATVRMLEQILAAVLGIRIGDDVLTAAVDRFHARQAIMRGGSYAP